MQLSDVAGKSHLYVRILSLNDPNGFYRFRIFNFYFFFILSL